MTPWEPRVLLVDDIEDNLIALEAILRPLPVRLIRARSGEEAMKALLREDFAVVLMDVVMPGMDGFETAARMKRLDQTRDVPVIFLSGYARTADNVFRSYALAAADYLIKPFDPWVLRAKVEAFVDVYRKSGRPEAITPAPARGFAVRLDDLEACVGRLETTVPRLESGMATAPRAELAAIAADLAAAVHDLRTAADAVAAGG